jgi:hypothetical protein
MLTDPTIIQIPATRLPLVSIITLQLASAVFAVFLKAFLGIAKTTSLPAGCAI